MKLIDSHAHLSSSSLYGDADAIIERGKLAGIEAVINICTDIETLERGLDLALRHPCVYNAASTTPHDVEKDGESSFSTFEREAKNGRLVAIGETGLDYFYHHSPVDTQKKFLRRYLRLALACQLPTIIHCRDAFTDFFEILDEEYKLGKEKWAPGVLHCFTGTVKEAEEVIARGWTLSLSGIVTYKKSAVLRDVAKFVPLEQLVIETDAPFLAPEGFRGKTNEPAYLIHTAKVIAGVKGISLEELGQATASNAKRLFSLNLKTTS